MRSLQPTSVSILQRWGRVLSVAIAVIAFLYPWFVEIEGLGPMGHRMLSIFLLAVVLWIAEPIPLYATSALIVFLLTTLVSDKAVVALPSDFEPAPYDSYFHCLADPILMLFLGGFFLADGAARFSLDRNLSRVLVKPFGKTPPKILLGVMLVTAGFSMFMSNTATTATMMAVVLPIVARLSASDPFRTGLVLAVPFAANLGGMGTPIGTPPNAIALGALNQAGHPIDFLSWMTMLVPFMLATLVAAWFVILRFHPPECKQVAVEIEGEFDRSPDAVVFYTVFAITVLLWLTENLHGMNSSMVGFFPVAALLCSGVFDRKNLQAMPWHILWLVAGGIALGKGVGDTGLDLWIISLVNWSGFGPVALIALLALFAMAVGTFISNSATANLLVPIGIGMASSGAVEIHPMQIGVGIAVGCSLAMALPISTPPNAIAYSAGSLATRDLAKSGIAVGLFAWLIFVFVANPLWVALGWIP